jgi:hypothetical protein
MRRWRVEAQRENKLLCRIEREARPLARQLRDRAADADAPLIQLAAAQLPAAPTSTCSNRPHLQPGSELDCGCGLPVDFLDSRRRLAELQLSSAVPLPPRNGAGVSPTAPTAATTNTTTRATQLLRVARRAQTALEAGLCRAEAELARAAHAAEAHAQSKARRLAALEDACGAQILLEELLA